MNVVFGVEELNVGLLFHASFNAAIGSGYEVYGSRKPLAILEI